MEDVTLSASFSIYENLMKLEKGRDLREGDSGYMCYLLNIYQLIGILISGDSDLQMKAYLCELRTGLWRHVPFMNAKSIIKQPKRDADY